MSFYSLFFFFFFTDYEEDEEDPTNFIVVDEFQGKFVPAVSRSSCYIRWCRIKVNLFRLIILRWLTSRGSMQSVSVPTVSSCSKMGWCVGCRWPSWLFVLIFHQSLPLSNWILPSLFPFFLNLAQIATKHKIYLFDILSLGGRAFKNGLSHILENKGILKVRGETRLSVLLSHTNVFLQQCLRWFWHRLFTTAESFPAAWTVSLEWN